MSNNPDLAPILVNPETDLVLDRVVPLTRAQIWEAWTNPELMKDWFCPKPWYVSEAEIDLRPGGIYRTVMNGPDGEVFPSIGTYLVVVPQERLVFTDALGPDFRPQPESFFTGIIDLEDTEEGTRYRAYALHATPENKQKHEEMGFHQGWGIALDQLVALMQSKP